MKKKITQNVSHVSMHKPDIGISNVGVRHQCPGESFACELSAMRGQAFMLWHIIKQELAVSIEISNPSKGAF